MTRPNKRRGRTISSCARGAETTSLSRPAPTIVRPHVHPLSWHLDERPRHHARRINSKPAAHVLTESRVLRAEARLQVAFLPRNDDVANQEKRGKLRKEDPDGIQNESYAGIHKGLSDVVRVATEAIGTRHDQLTRWPKRGDGSS